MLLGQKKKKVIFIIPETEVYLTHTQKMEIIILVIWLHFKQSSFCCGMTGLKTFVIVDSNVDLLKHEMQNKNFFEKTQKVTHHFQYALKEIFYLFQLIFLFYCYYYFF